MRTNLFNEPATSIDSKKKSNEDETFSNPIDISDILNVCKEFSKLGWQVQSQIECIMELGIDEAIKTGMVSIAALPHIKEFLKGICQNVYFGDAADQAYECINLIDYFEEQNPNLFNTKVN